MNENKILHVMILDKFLAPYIDFVDEHFGRENHHYVFITSEKYEYGLTPEHNVEFLYTDDDIFITLLEYMKMANKIILHGLWRDKVDVLLYFNQELLKKCYWAMWGGDFYFPETKSKIRHEIIKKMGYLLSCVNGDFELAEKWYKAEGEYINHRVGYPSNLYREHQEKTKLSSIINIQLGNSATTTNNHFDMLYKLEKYKNNDIQIFVPLSYGNKEYAKEVIKKGDELYGGKFIALTEFMPFEKYIEFLSEIDIAIFNHERQQAFGNIITLLGLGKKVFLNSESTVYKLLKEKKINIFSTYDISLDPLSNKEKETNIKIIKNNFSDDNLLKDCQLYLS